MTIQQHPVCDAYEFDSTTGKYRKVGANEWLDGNLNAGYRTCSISAQGNKKQKSYRVHRAVWETFNGTIEPGMEIDHIDNDKTNNKLCNLQCVTPSINRARRNHDFLKDVRKKNIIDGTKSNIKSINIETSEEHVFKSKSACARYVGCSPALVYLICEGTNRSKTFGGKYRFEYTNDDVDVTLQNGRSGKKYPRKYHSDEEKKQAHKVAMKRYYHKNKANQKIAEE